MWMWSRTVPNRRFQNWFCNICEKQEYLSNVWFPRLLRLLRENLKQNWKLPPSPVQRLPLRIDWKSRGWTDRNHLQNQTCGRLVGTTDWYIFRKIKINKNCQNKVYFTCEKRIFQAKVAYEFSPTDKTKDIDPFFNIVPDSAILSNLMSFEILESPSPILGYFLHHESYDGSITEFSC